MFFIIFKTVAQLVSRPNVFKLYFILASTSEYIQMEVKDIEPVNQQSCTFSLLLQEAQLLYGHTP